MLDGLWMCWMKSAVNVGVLSILRLVLGVKNVYFEVPNCIRV